MLPYMVLVSTSDSGFMLYGTHESECRALDAAREYANDLASAPCRSWSATSTT